MVPEDSHEPGPTPDTPTHGLTQSQQAPHPLHRLQVWDEESKARPRQEGRARSRSTHPRVLSSLATSSLSQRTPSPHPVQPLLIADMKRPEAARCINNFPTPALSPDPPDLPPPQVWGLGRRGSLWGLPGKVNKMHKTEENPKVPPPPPQSLQPWGG